ncbi:MAG: hypothetical protein QOH37_3502, partial [Nocardioidaceae bacterium]|nr:hypothetical protein [Nocardioidaceae bacterium]
MARPRTRFAPDTGLTVRMTSVMFLLGALFVAFMVVLDLELAHLSGQAGLARERLAGEVLPADVDGLLCLVGQLLRLGLQRGQLHLDALAAGGHVGHAATYLREHLQLPLVAVVERVA